VWFSDTLVEVGFYKATVRIHWGFGIVVKFVCRKLANYNMLRTSCSSFSYVPGMVEGPAGKGLGNGHRSWHLSDWIRARPRE